MGLARRIPHGDQYGRASGLEKAVLREALRGLLPAGVLARPKRAFLVPSVLGLPEGAAWARERLLGGGLIAGGWCDGRGLEQLLAEPSSPARDAGVFLLASLSILLGAYPCPVPAGEALRGGACPGLFEKGCGE